MWIGIPQKPDWYPVGRAIPISTLPIAKASCEKTTIPSPPITNPQSPIANHQSPIANPHSPIPNRQPPTAETALAAATAARTPTGGA